MLARHGDFERSSSETGDSCTSSDDDGQNLSGVSGSSSDDGQTSASSAHNCDDDSTADCSSRDSSTSSACPGSSSTHRRDGRTTATESRASGPGRGRLVWEVCCSPNSTITACAHALGFKAERLTLETGWDFSKPEDGARAVREVQSRGVKKVWLSLPCTPWSSIQNLNHRTLQQRRRLKKQRRLSRQMAQVTLPVLLAVLREGGDFYFEWPTRCQGWNIKELREFKKQVGKLGRTIQRCRVDGCSYGLKNKTGDKHLLKRWTILTSDEHMYTHLSRTCPKQHTHATIQGGDTAHSAYYPVGMAAMVALVWAAT